MKIQTLHSFLARALAVATLGVGLHAAPAAAETYDVGPLGGLPYVNFRPLPAGSFLDLYYFTHQGDSLVAAVVLPIKLPLGGISLLNVDDLTLSLYNGSNLLLGSLSASPANPLSFGSMLDAGNYHFGLSGTADGILGGAYLFSLADMGFVSAIPEPGPWLLLGVGLGFLGLLGRGRAQRSREAVA